MHSWEAIEQSLDYIEEHLQQDIAIEALAQKVNLSVYYFQRLFRRLVNQSVTEYVKLRKLAKASDEIINTDKRIIDIALTYGFSSHPSFTRAFKEVYGITPEVYRKEKPHLNHFVKPELSLHYEQVQENVPLIVDGIVIEITRQYIEDDYKIVGVKGQVDETELGYGKSTGVSTIGELWDAFHQKKMKIRQQICKDKEYGLLYKGEAREGCFMYLAGAKAKELVVDQQVDQYTLEAGEYLVCQVEAESFQDLIDSAIYKASMFLNQWIVQHEIACGNYAVEVYEQMTEQSSYMELWMPIKASQKRKQPVWDKTNQQQKPTMAILKDFVDNILFEQLCDYLEQTHQSKPSIEYSQCSMQYGWNIKYKKSGRALCTIYPEVGRFIALVVVGQREVVKIEGALPLFTQYTQKLYRDTKSGMGQKWLMVEVSSDAILQDVKHMIDVRRGKKARMYK